MSRSLSGFRVAVLVQNLPVPFDRRVWMEATTLQRAGADVTVICPSDDRHPEGEFSIEGVRVFRYAATTEASGPVGYIQEYGLSLLRMKRALRRARGRYPFDAVHFCNPPDLLYLAAKTEKRKFGSVAIFDQHDLGPELVEAKSMPFAPIFVSIAKWAEKQTYRFADYVVSTNESYRAIALERGGFRPDQVTVVRSGPDSTWGASATPHREKHVNGRKFLIGYLGVMGRQEGIEYLLDSIQILAAQGLDCQLALVGSGPDRERLEEYARDLGISERVTFYGRVPDADLMEILASSDVCVNPDEVNPMNSLSTMNKIIEYMALGRPIVQFDVKEGRFSAQEASLYAKPNDAKDFANKISEVLKDSELAKTMGEFGRTRFATDLNWEVQGGELVSMYERVMKDVATRKRTVKAV